MTAIESNVEALHENQRDLVSILGGANNSSTQTGQVAQAATNNDIVKQIVELMKKEKSDQNRDQEQIVPRQYRSYCYSGGVNLWCNGSDDKCHNKCPSNRPTVHRPTKGRSPDHDKTATYTDRKNGSERCVDRWLGWVCVSSGRYAKTKEELLTRSN